MKRLDEVCTIIMGQAPSGEAYNSIGEGWPLIAGAGDFRGMLPAPKKYTTQASKLSMNGDIILGIRASIGAKVFADGEYCLGRGVAALRARAELDQRYLWHWLDSSARELASKGKGATFKQVNRQDIGEMMVPVPALAEQRRIAEALDGVGALRAKRGDAIALLDSLAQALFIDMFGDPQINPRGWPTVSLAGIVESGERINYGVVQPGDDFPDGVPLIRAGDLAGGVVDRTGIKLIDPKIEAQYSRSRINGSEILVGCVGSIGAVSIVSEQDIGSNVARAVARIPIRSRGLRRYVAECLRSESVQSYFASELRTVAQPTLNIKQLCQTMIMLPPDVLVDQFAARVEAIEAETVKHRESSAKLDELYAAVQSRAFTGTLFG